MRMSVSPKSGLPVARMLAVSLLASVAAGCSSDATRFSGLFSSTDDITTSSTPRRNITGLNGTVPVPDGDMAVSSVSQQPDYTSRQQAMSQPYPAQPGYNAPSNVSAARMASAPVSVQRAELSAPTGQPSAMRPPAQPFPAEQRVAAAPAIVPPESDNLTTGSNPQGAKGNGWSTANAPRVALRPGETIGTLSARYGVPEKEILKANGLTKASAAGPGQTIIIPTNGARATPVRASADGALLPAGQTPVPNQAPEQKVAVLPASGTLRDKSQPGDNAAGNKVVSGDGKAPPPAGGSYVVKPGDSLSKIAKATGTPMDALKSANGIKDGNIRIGQSLKLPGAGSAAVNPDTVKTASVPAKTAEPSSPAPFASPAPVKTQTVNEVTASADPKDIAPESTGISKYRWPVTGAVVAGFGANVDGKRNDGIDISVPTGTPVKAAENGVVIYAGNGLKELGNTVLVRHDDGTVTVYGHTEAVGVTRGQKVQRGQQLATSGMSGNVKRPMLHFEVRKDATPVNPMTFLD
ncbi:peptidoglycan DD-metalloendopeptidase family protein [Rhizobium sp. CG5]|uniref:peptidoglycan DD-metalloendopeptidase family protein n=1 Tax=Rhizobium sp. CG5 TaxID=2726076 RepID=UPI0020339620|nr:peptidoglycan DD-metalloendopeptidase family protein [Rhizobium sp. CG5]MCM2472197.1 peptidoglycan DD-metalloendopeptidase family protein [Rhizobium sp. CG5]